MLLKKEEVGKTMFQKMHKDIQNQTKEETKKTTNILTNVISKKYILLYIISLMISTIGMGQDISPFSIAMVGAIIANEIPVIAIIILGLIGNIIGNGASSILSYIVILLKHFTLKQK